MLQVSCYDPAVEYAEGLVLEIQQVPGFAQQEARAQAFISCPPGLIPRPGQYVLAHSISAGQGPAREIAPLAETLFPGALTWETVPHARPPGFWAAPPLPAFWRPGTRLWLSGPRGVGFQLPTNCRHLGVAALGDHAVRVALLIKEALQNGCDVALFGEPTAAASMPADVEVHPRAELASALTWMDLLAIDLPLDALGDLRDGLGLAPRGVLPCPAQALLSTPLPCGGVGECGVCAAPGRRGWILPCIDGPVLDLDRVLW